MSNLRAPMSRCCPPRIALLVQIHRSSQHRHRRKQTNVAAAVHASTLHAAMAPLTDIMVDFSIAKIMIHQLFKAYDVNQIIVEIIKFGIEMTNAALVGALLARYKKVNNRSR